jgi:hypothetical protein
MCVRVLAVRLLGVAVRVAVCGVDVARRSNNRRDRAIDRRRRRRRARDA